MNSDGRVVITVTQFADELFGGGSVTRLLEWDLQDDPSADPTQNVLLSTDNSPFDFFFGTTINDFNDIIFSGLTQQNGLNIYDLDANALLSFPPGEQPTLLGEISLLNNPNDRTFVFWQSTPLNGDFEYCIDRYSEDGDLDGLDLDCTFGGTLIDVPDANDAGDVYYRNRTPREFAGAQGQLNQSIEGLTADGQEVSICPVPISVPLTGPSVNSAGNVAFFAGGSCFDDGDPSERGIYFYDAAEPHLELVVDFDQYGLDTPSEIRGPLLNGADRIAFVARESSGLAGPSDEFAIYVYNPENAGDEQLIKLDDGANPNTQRILLGYVATADADRILYLAQNDQQAQTLFLADMCEVTIGCGQPDAGNCCEANGTPSCEDNDCCSLICRDDPFCCDENGAWDYICAQAANERCFVCNPCPADLNGDGVVDTEDQFLLLADWGPCDDPLDCPADLNGDGVVDTEDQFILLGAWGDCPDPTACGQPLAGNCCETNGTPYCNDLLCCDTVCASDPFCCDDADGHWDAICAQAANERCNTCDNCPGDLNGDGVVDTEDQFLLLADWGPCDDPLDCPADLNGDGVVDTEDQFILLGAWGDCPDPTACGQPLAGNCCEANGTPYCNDVACCEAVCAVDPFCCETDWDGICANVAEDICQVCALCPEDLNGDGVVDTKDLFELLAAWGTCADPDNCPADLTGDGEVDTEDLFELLAAWGDCPDTPPVCVLEWDPSIGQPGLQGGSVLDMAVFQDMLVVGGWFTSAGEQNVPFGFAWWDGMQWHAPAGKAGLGGGKDLFVEITALKTVEPAGGALGGDQSALLVAQWTFDSSDNEESAPIFVLTSFLDEPELLGIADTDVFAFELFDDGAGIGPAYCVGGRFSEVDGVEAFNIACLVGTTWSEPFSVLESLNNRATGCRDEWYNMATLLQGDCHGSTEERCPCTRRWSDQRPRRSSHIATARPT